MQSKFYKGSLSYMQGNAYLHAIYCVVYITHILCLLSLCSKMSKSAEEGLPLPAADEPSDVAPSHSKKTKMVFAVLLIVGVVAAVGVCAAVFAPADKGQMPADREGDRVQPNEDLEARHSKVRLHPLLYVCFDLLIATTTSFAC